MKSLRIEDLGSKVECRYDAPNLRLTSPSRGACLRQAPYVELFDRTRRTMSAPAIVFVHGAFSSGSDFAAWADFFAQAGFECFNRSLPGHSPADVAALRSLSIIDYTAAVLQLVRGLPEPPVLVGHSMGGLIAQHVCAAAPSRALICIASAPPGFLTAQPRALPHLVPLLPSILAGRPVRPSPEAFRALALNDLQEQERDAIARGLGAESGRAYREMIFGLSRVDAHRVTCPVLCLSGDVDRIISTRLAESVARRYQAKHIGFAGRGHWLIAPSGVSDVAAAAKAWLTEAIGVHRSRSAFPSRSPLQ